MQKRITLFAALLAAALMASNALAQDTTGAPASTGSTPTATTTKAKKSKGGGAAAKADKELASLTQTLSLTDDQQAKIKPILADESSKIRAAKKTAGSNTADKKAKSKAIREDAQKQISALLTPDQQKLYADSTRKGAKKSAAPASPESE